MTPVYSETKSETCKIRLRIHVESTFPSSVGMICNFRQQVSASLSLFYQLTSINTGLMQAGTDVEKHNQNNFIHTNGVV